MTSGEGGFTRRGFLAGAATLTAAGAWPAPARAVPPAGHRRVLLLPQALADHEALAGLVAGEQATGTSRPLVIAAAMPAALRQGPTLSRISPPSLLAVSAPMLLKLVRDAPPEMAAAIVAAPVRGRPAPTLPAVGDALGRLLAERDAPAMTIWVQAGDGPGLRNSESAIRDGLRSGLGDASARTEVLAIEIADDGAARLRPLPLAPLTEGRP